MSGQNILPVRRPRLVPFQPFTPAEWQGKPTRPREWLVDGCFMPGTVCMLSGDGGLGKSLLMLQLQTAAAIGQPWLGLETRPVRSFGYYCEDEKDELHRRQVDVCAHYGVEPGDLGDHVTMISRVGADDNVLVQSDRHGNIALTPVFDQVMNHVTQFGAQLIILDTLADIFDGNEIHRNVARKCVTLLRTLAVKTQGCVIVNSHPSLTGINSGTGQSGSTGWNGAVRQRLYLTRAPAESDGSESQDRLLKTMKNNYGPDGARLRLRWDKGVFVRVDGGVRPANLVDRLDADRRILDALRSLVANGTLVAAAHNKASGFANILRESNECKEYSPGFMRAAQERLLGSGRIVRVELGPRSKRRVYVRPADLFYPGETGATDGASL